MHNAGPAIEYKWKQQDKDARAASEVAAQAGSKTSSGSGGGHSGRPRLLWHSWHLNRLQVAAREAPDIFAERWLEAQTVLKGSRPFVSSAQVKLCFPL
jgi:hypothetical protein